MCAGLLAFGDESAVAGRRIEGADPGARRAHALGEVALRDDLELDFAGAKSRVEHVQVRLARERAEDFFHPSLFDELGEAGLAVACVVGDYGEVLCALGDQRVNQRSRLAGQAKAADQHRCAVADIGDSLGDGSAPLVDHLERLSLALSSLSAVAESLMAAIT